MRNYLIQESDRKLNRQLAELDEFERKAVVSLAAKNIDEPIDEDLVARVEAKGSENDQSELGADVEEQKEQTDGGPAGDFSDRSNNSAIAANTPGSMNTGTGGQKTDIESEEMESSSNPLTNLYAAINNLKDRSISFKPAYVRLKSVKIV
mgnify:CR=1 FL=1